MATAWKIHKKHPTDPTKAFCGRKLDPMQYTRSRGWAKVDCQLCLEMRPVPLGQETHLGYFGKLLTLIPMCGMDQDPIIRFKRKQVTCRDCIENDDAVFNLLASNTIEQDRVERTAS